MTLFEKGQLWSDVDLSNMCNQQNLHKRNANDR